MTKYTYEVEKISLKIGVRGKISQNKKTAITKKKENIKKSKAAKYA